MGASDPPLIKQFFIKHKFDIPPTFQSEHDGVFIIDLDIAFNMCFFTARTGELDALFKKLHNGILEEVRHHNETNFVEGKRIRQIMLLSTFLEERSGFLKYKAKTHTERAKGGLTEEQIAERGDFATWKYISDEDEKQVRKTRHYKYWVMNAVFKMLFDEFGNAMSSGLFDEEMGINKVHFVGYCGKHYCMSSESDNEHGYSMSAVEMNGGGEADVHLRSIAGFDEMLRKFAIIYKTTDTDALPITLNLPRAWSFDCGFYLNTGVMFRKSKARPEDVYLWIDLKAARNSSIDWSLFGLCFVLLGTDYCDPVPLLNFNDIDASMEKWKSIDTARTTPLAALIRELSVKRQKTAEEECANVDAITWNLQYWGIEYS